MQSNAEVLSSESSKNVFNHFSKIGIKNATLPLHHMGIYAKNYLCGLKKKSTHIQRCHSNMLKMCPSTVLLSILLELSDGLYMVQPEGFSVSTFLGSSNYRWRFKELEHNTGDGSALKPTFSQSQLKPPLHIQVLQRCAPCKPFQTTCDPSPLGFSS